MAEEYERVSLVKPEVFIYQIPPRISNRAVRAADWNLTAPDWKGRLRIVSLGEKCIVKLEDKISGLGQCPVYGYGCPDFSGGELFAVCPVDKFPGVAVEPVSDSSRYFLLRLQDTSGKNAFVGLGFEDRGDAFDFNVALQDHFKKVEQEQTLAAESTQPIEHKDYSLRAGQKIQLNLGKNVLNKDEENSRPKQTTIGLSASGGLLPPPGPSSNTRPIQSSAGPWQSQPPSTQGTREDWGDFATFDSASKPKDSSTGGDWVQF